MGKRTWDFETGVCPWGHEISDCGRQYTRRDKTNNHRPVSDANPPSEDDVVRGGWVCKYHEREKGRARYKREHPVVRAIGRPLGSVAAGTFTGSTKNAGFGSTREHPSAMLTLVCGCERIYPRGGLDANQQYYCPAHEDWKNIHEISAFLETGRARLCYPLETPIKRTVWQHQGNVGSGRA